MAKLFDAIPLAIIVLLLVYFVAKSGGQPALQEGLQQAWKAFLNFAVALAFIFIAMGMAKVLVAHYQNEIRAEMSGGRGLLGSWFVAIWSPGSISGLPEARSMWEDGSFDKGALLIFLITSMTANAQTTFMRAPYMGWWLTFITYGIQLVYSILFLGIVWLVMKLLR